MRATLERLKAARPQRRAATATIGAGIAAVATMGIVAGAAVAAVYARDMRKAYGRLRGRSTVVASPFGDIEYAEGGAGPDVLAIHGSGGGCDQGELFAEAVLGDGFRWVAPSRFGYLRSTFHDRATFAEQADAYACLLDRLGVGRVAVVALSHGGPSALLFAAAHPERVSSLTLVSCGVASSGAPGQAAANRRGDLLATVFKHDPVYWAVSRFFRRRLFELLGASDEIVAGLTPGQHGLLDRVVDGMNPVSPRAAGVAFDNAAALPDERVRDVQAPTLILHARDDSLQLYHNAEFAAANIPGARLRSFATGGHIVMLAEQAAVRAAVRRHVLEHARVA